MTGAVSTVFWWTPPHPSTTFAELDMIAALSALRVSLDHSGGLSRESVRRVQLRCSIMFADVLAVILSGVGFSVGVVASVILFRREFSLSIWCSAGREVPFPHRLLRFKLPTQRNLQTMLNYNLPLSKCSSFGTQVEHGQSPFPPGSASAPPTQTAIAHSIPHAYQGRELRYCRSRTPVNRSEEGGVWCAW
jgi:hypothetical protein